jgi:hypothetical protein
MGDKPNADVGKKNSIFIIFNQIISESFKVRKDQTPRHKIDN